MTNIDFDLVDELQTVIAGIGSGAIWRPVRIPEVGTLCEGIGDRDDGLAEALLNFAFHGKTVVDLGCNLGYYSFLVKKAGARSVLGVDIDPRLVRGCQLLQRLLQIEDVSFVAADITNWMMDKAFDIGMMIDLVGKETIRTGLFPRFLDTLERLTTREMVLSLRPAYLIDKHLDGQLASLLELYGDRHVRDGRFDTLGYLAERFAPRWEMRIIAPRDLHGEGSVKETVHLVRRTG